MHAQVRRHDSILRTVCHPERAQVVTDAARIALKLWDVKLCQPGATEPESTKLTRELRKRPLSPFEVARCDPPVEAQATQTEGIPLRAQRDPAVRVGSWLQDH
jgi:hypothetical protein